MTATEDGFTFSTGRTFYANGCIIGIDPDLGISEGYDGNIWGSREFTENERRELADYMIGLWQKYKEAK